MDAKTRARAARASAATLDGQEELFHVEQAAKRHERWKGQLTFEHRCSTECPTELLKSILGAVEVKQ